MAFYTNLPLAARVAIPAVVALIVAFLLYSMMLKPAPPVEIIKTQDVGEYSAAKAVLDRRRIVHDETEDAGRFTITVRPEARVEAQEALLASGIKDRTGNAKAITCPAVPGFTGTRAANERSDNCAAAKTVQQMLLTAGAIAANVSVSREENGTLLGPEKSINVSAQVFLPSHMKGNWPAESAAVAVARAIGTSTERIYIGDDKLQPLFDGSGSGGSGAGSAGSEGTGAGLGLGCGDIADATEIATKQAAVSACFESKIAPKLTELLGSTDAFVLSVDATIDSVASTTETTKNAKGPIVEKSSQKGDGSSVLDESSPPNTSVTNSSNPAGDIAKLKLSVQLDSKLVNSQQELGVKRLLQTYIEPGRKDPAPLVDRFPFAAGTGDKPVNEEAEGLKAQAEAGGSAAANGASIIPEKAAPEIVTPKWMLALLAVAAIATLTAILILWRRSVAMAGERTRIESAFRSDQRLFENFAQQNSADLAREMEALFGAPPATQPTR